jgi:peroxiredoxin
MGALLTAGILAAFLLSQPVGSAMKDDTIPADTDDRPLFTSFNVTPATLTKNRINWVTMEFTFKDDLKNLIGGTLNINFVYSPQRGKFYTFPLLDKVFTKAAGSYKLQFALLGEKFDQVTVFAWMRDTAGTSGNESEYITLQLDQQDPVGGKQGYKVGQKAYDFTLLDKNGKEFSLSQYKGKVVLLDFSTGWCTYCAKEAGDHKEFLLQYQDLGFEIITVLTEGVSTGPARPKDCKLWARRFKLKSPVLADTLYGVYYAYTRFTNTQWYPYNFIIDQNGVIRWKKIGYKDDGSTRRQMERKIEQLLAQ